MPAVGVQRAPSPPPLQERHARGRSSAAKMTAAISVWVWFTSLAPSRPSSELVPRPPSFCMGSLLEACILKIEIELKLQTLAGTRGSTLASAAGEGLVSGRWARQRPSMPGRPLESRLAEWSGVAEMPSKLDFSPSGRSARVQIFTLEDINAISSLSPPPIDPSDDLAEPESLDLADDPPPRTPPPTPPPRLRSSARAASLRPDASGRDSDAADKGGSPTLEALFAYPSRSPAPAWASPAASRPAPFVVAHFSAEEILALDGKPNTPGSLADELPDDMWLYWAHPAPLAQVLGAF
ncbi:hypothetical protein T492DRAFT_1134568 [Pavlovales sp. CCMP2436]|nr:hypothetical protein T492DRAFT_1134568 [Pavlovales sp. CCMP2436]